MEKSNLTYIKGDNMDKYNKVLLLVPIKIGGRPYNDIDVSNILEVTGITCEVYATDKGALIKQVGKDNKLKETLVPYSGVSRFER